ncbi:hypothetical protein PV392_01975 [Streptomyces sp. ME03-5709C]|nr:hypothetical protein [Streptomyces sp. ME03-5709C]
MGEEGVVSHRAILVRPALAVPLPDERRSPVGHLRLGNGKRISLPSCVIPRRVRSDHVRRILT